MEKDDLMKISEIAEFFGVTPKALRLYEQKGIILPCKIDSETGYRYYSADQVKKLNALIELQELGFSLNEIKNIMDGGLKSEGFKEALYSKKVHWEQEKAEIQKKIDAIENIEDRLSKKLGDNIEKMTEDERALWLLNVVCIEDLKATKALSDAIWL